MIKMRKAILLVVILIGFRTNAQENKSITIGLGGATNDYFMNNRKRSIHKESDAILFLDFNYKIVKDIAIRASILASYKQKNVTPYFTSNYNYFKTIQYGFLLGVNKEWIKKDRFFLHSVAQLGMNHYYFETATNIPVISQRNYSDNKFIYQISPIEMRFGREYGFVLFFGYGYKGLMGIGVDCIF